MIRLAEVAAADPLLAQPIGWLKLQGELTFIQVEAALLYGRQRQDWDFVNGVSPRSAKAQNMNAVRGVSLTAVDNAKRGKAYERTRDGVLSILGYSVGREALEAMDASIMAHEATPHWQLNALKAGLYAVAEVNGITHGRSDIRKLKRPNREYPTRIGPKQPHGA